MWKVSLLCFILLFCGTSANSIKRPSKWWDGSIIYQIYPRSFKDSDGDGIGDLDGITSKLEYVRDIADVFWISPIYASPQHDFGYDISDYVTINPEYGNIENFEKLVAKAKSLGLRVLLDFVPNHSSSQHEWFKKSVKRIKPYDDYYIWRDAKILPDGNSTVPTNWLSVFGKTTWKWNEEREQYYLHQYDETQPDLNYRNPLVRQEMEKVLSFWLNKGIDGFRVDAIQNLVEDDQFRDEPRSSNDVPPDDYFYLEHIYTKDLDMTYDIVHSWRKLADNFSATHGTDEKMLLMECGSALPFVMKYYDVGVDPFNFGFLHSLSNDSSADVFLENIMEWLDTMPKGKIANWVVGNHDVNRVASRYGYNYSRADQISMLSTVLPGVTVLYNGDEIGMVNRFFTYEETVDPMGCNAGPDRYQVKSRDPARTPFQWDSTVSAGFSTNKKTWLPVHENYKTHNLALQKKADVSHYKVYKALTELKKLPVIMEGRTEMLLAADNVLAILRWTNTETIILLINFNDDHVEIDLNDNISVEEKMMVYTASVKSGIRSGEIVKTNTMLLPGAASVILGDEDVVSTLLNVV